MEFSESAYGSDKHGLVWAYLFVPGEAGVPIVAERAAEWLGAERLQRTDAFLWLHFALSNTGSGRWLRAHAELPEAFYELLSSSAVSTRLEHEDSTLMGVLHDVPVDSSFDSSAVSTMSLALTPGVLVTARLRPLRSVERVRTAVKSGNTFRSSTELLAELLRDQANVLVDIVRESTGRVDMIEDDLLANHLATSRSELSAMRRALVRLQRLLAPEPTALFRLLNRPPRWMDRDDVQDLRQAAEEFSAAVADSAALTERVRLLQEELAARINEQTNRTLFVLTVVTVMALPINLIAGLFGMNVGGIPFSENGHGFIYVLGTVTVLTAVLAWIGFGKKRD